ncbi:MAG: 1,4-dihydroxy-2-naphthoate polyprenyltransferase [Thermodesulfobacteriota bacterium]|nr:1,4-dihydroxy-2-naphthoate polyprenyltransferase [Thermodesulfobacteriota bacterium]
MARLSTFNIWVLAARPKTLWAAIAPVMVGTAMAFETGKGAWLPALAALFGAVMIQIGTNFANDYFDHQKGTDTEHRLGPLRVTQAGLVQPETMKWAIALAFFMAGTAGIYLVWQGGWPIFIVGCLSILSGIFYTAGPYPLGYTGLADLFVLIFFGPVAVGGTYYVQTLEMHHPVLWSGLAPGLFSVAILTVNNLRDIEEDKRAGKKTLAVRFGRSYAQGQYLLCLVSASAIPAMLYILEGNHPVAMVTIVLPLAALSSIRLVFTTRDGPKLNGVLAFTGKLLLLYSVVFSVGWLL